MTRRKKGKLSLKTVVMITAIKHNYIYTSSLVYDVHPPAPGGEISPTNLRPITTTNFPQDLASRLRDKKMLEMLVCCYAL